MPEAHTASPTLDPPRSGPVGLILLIAGIVFLLAAIGFGLGFLQAGLAKQFVTIGSSDPVQVELPTGRPLIVTRSAELAPDHEQFRIDFIGSATFDPDPKSGWLEVQSQKQDILGRIRVDQPQPVTISAQAAAYPLVIRHDPMAHAIRSLVITGFAGSFALALSATGVFIMIKHSNTRARHRQTVIDGLSAR